MPETPHLTLLNVDDNAAGLYLKSRILRQAGFTVLEATTGRQALELVQAHQPALVLLDVNLPDINGMEVCHRLKADPTTATTLVLHISATWSETEHRVRGLEGGADGYLIDSVTPEELIATVKALVRLWQREQENRQLLARLRQETAERKAVEAALRDNEERFLRLTGNINSIFWIVDPRQRRILYLSDGFNRIVGLDPRPLLEDYANFIRLIHPQDLLRTEQAFRHKAPRGEFNEEYRLRLPDGTIRWLHDRIFPMRDEHGKIYRYMGISEDITARKQAEQALRDADRRKDEFLAMLAHELRNPLAPIRNATQILRRLGSGEPRLDWAQQVIERQVEHMTRLIDDLLDVSRISQGRIALNRQPIALAAVIEQALETSRVALDARRHHLTVELAPEPLELAGDPTRLAQVVANLLHNAAKFTPEGGRIDLSAARDGGSAVIRVKDSGIGISAEFLPQIFDLFAQADRSLERSQGGLGIGLTLVRKLVELHGGSVEARSEGYGQGAEFTVKLPLLTPAAAGARTPGPAPVEARPAAGLRVLVVDDQALVAESTALLLELAGHQPRTAATGSDALDAAEVFQPQVVVLDIGLPGLDGYEVARRLRQRPDMQQTLLIAITGYGQPQDRQLAAAAGFDHHLVKPVAPDVLQALIAQYQAGGCSRRHAAAVDSAP